MSAGRPLCALPLRAPADAAAAGGLARQAAALLGLDALAQARVAAAAHALAWHALQRGGGAFRLLAREGTLRAEAEHAAMPGGAAEALGAAGRLARALEEAALPGGGSRIALLFPLPPGAGWPDGGLPVPAAPEGAAAAMAALNGELAEALLALGQREEALARLGAELEDTNRGVVALHAELDAQAEALRRASELKSRFLSNMSHEFRTPLNSILALSQLLLDRADGPLLPEQERQVQLLRRSAGNLLEMVDDLLDLAKVEAGKVTLRLAPFAVAELLGGLRAALRPLQHSAVELVFEDAAGLPILVSDEGKVAQILRNLVSNALKFTRSGTVRVSAESRGAEMVLTVADTGIGIAPEDLERIFDEFSQVESAQGGGRQKGTGLGLPLSRQLAALLGGRISVESTPGRGSVFRLHLPLPSEGVAAAPGTVLVIDDDESFRYVFRQWISEMGYPVMEAAGGHEGLAMARTARPSAVVLDLRMPDLDGAAVLQALRMEAATRDIPVVIATGSTIDAGLRATLEGAAALLSKDRLKREGVAEALRRLLPLPSRPEAGA